MDAERLKVVACQAIDRVAEELNNVSQEIWKKPELNYDEHNAHKVLTTFLENQGFQVEKRYKLDTAFCATVGEGHPHVAVLCEYDALPEIGHACGHNLIAEVGVAAGVGIKAALEESGQPLGKLIVLGTPAEEGGNGKDRLIKQGAFSDIDVAMMSHPFIRDLSYLTTLLAVDTIPFSTYTFLPAVFKVPNATFIELLLLAVQRVIRCMYDVIIGLILIVFGTPAEEGGGGKNVLLEEEVFSEAALEESGQPLGKLIVLGTPAEEGGNGKDRLIKQGAFSDIDVAMMSHPFIRDLSYLTTLLAVDTIPFSTYTFLPAVFKVPNATFIELLLLAVQRVIRCMYDVIIGLILIVFGTPAEEGGGGKNVLLEEEVFSEVDLGMMSHPGPDNVSHPTMAAREMITVTYRGRASHAAAFPWNGINALDAAVLCYQTVSCFRQQMKPTWRVHGIITNGGAKPNIIPEVATLEYYIRAPNRKELKILREKIMGCFESAAKGTGCTVEYEFPDTPYLNVINNMTLVSVFEKNAQAVGIEYDNDVDRQQLPMGSTDMGNVSYEVPSIHPFFHIGTEAVNHTRDFTTAAGDPKAQPYTLQQGKALAMTAIDVLTNPELLKQIKTEFQNEPMRKE